MSSFWIPVLGASIVLALGIYLVIWCFCGGARPKKRRIRCGVSEDVRARLEKFVSKVNPKMILDGSKSGVRKVAKAKQKRQSFFHGVGKRRTRCSTGQW
jgi:hypothetical protein